ncbi:MAG: hypothetical protein ACOC3V_00710 [bacterium]
MLTKFKNFLNENISDDNMLKLMYYLDTIQSKYRSENTDDEPGKYLDYEVKDNTILLSYGFTGYEEHSSHESTIIFNKNDISIIEELSGYSVMGGEDGDYHDKYSKSFDNVDELIKWLNLEDV